MLLLVWRTVVITVLVFPGNLEEDLRRNLNPSPGPRQVTFRQYYYSPKLVQYHSRSHRVQRLSRPVRGRPPAFRSTV